MFIRILKTLIFFGMGFLSYPLICRYCIYFVGTGSMHPSIPKGSLILVDKNIECKKGEVVTYKYKNSSLVTHRVLDIKRIGGGIFYFTKGDANELSDKLPVDDENIQGKVVFFIPFLGYLLACLIHPLFLLFFFYLPVGYAFGCGCKQFVKQFGT